MFHEPDQNSCVKFREIVYQKGQDEVWRRRMAVLILWCYACHRPGDCLMRVLVAVMIALISLHENEQWKDKAGAGEKI